MGRGIVYTLFRNGYALPVQEAWRRVGRSAAGAAAVPDKLVHSCDTRCLTAVKTLTNNQFRLDIAPKVWYNIYNCVKMNVEITGVHAKNNHLGET